MNSHIYIECIQLIIQPTGLVLSSKLELSYLSLLQGVSSSMEPVLPLGRICGELLVHGSLGFRVRGLGSSANVIGSEARK